MNTRDAWIGIMAIAAALLACQKKEGPSGSSGLEAARTAYMVELGASLGKDCDVNEEGSESEPGFVVSCKTEELVERAKTKIKEDCPKIRSAGFKNLRAYVSGGQSSLKGSVEIGCRMM